MGYISGLFLILAYHFSLLFLGFVLSVVLNADWIFAWFYYKKAENFRKRGEDEAERDRNTLKIEKPIFSARTLATYWIVSCNSSLGKGYRETFSLHHKYTINCENCRPSYRTGSTLRLEKCPKTGPIWMSILCTSRHVCLNWGSAQRLQPEIWASTYMIRLLFDYWTCKYHCCLLVNYEQMVRT